jgi:4-hydroxybutyrate dehydrogenase / sulfolactaldehyde 3-reductase
MSKKVGFVGLGRMGLPMALNLCKAGHVVTGFDVQSEAISRLQAGGGQGTQDIRAAVRDAEVVFTMLPNSAIVQSVILEQIAPALPAGIIVVDMSTIDPLTTDTVAEDLASRGIRFADAPVGRLAQHADRGECLFMVGAQAEVFDTIRPLLTAMGTTIHHCGGPGAGIRMKVVNNYLAIAACQLNAETLTLAARFGLDLEQTLEVLNGTTATNGHLKTNFPMKVLKGDIAPGFQIELAHKDLGLALAAGASMNVPLAMGSTARECLQLARAGGHAREDFSALLDIWCRFAGVVPPRLTPLR